MLGVLNRTEKGNFLFKRTFPFKIMKGQKMRREENSGEETSQRGRERRENKRLGRSSCGFRVNERRLARLLAEDC